MARTHFHNQLTALCNDVVALGELAAEALDRAIECLQENDRHVASALVTDDHLLDERHASIQRNAITLLTTQQPVASDLRAITASMAIAGELERIGDYAAGIAALILRAPNEPQLEPPHGLYLMSRTARTMLRQSLDAYIGRDAAIARRVGYSDTSVDTFQHTLSRELLLTMIENPSTLTRATYQLWTVHNLERVADRATNICEQVIFLVEGEWPNLQQRPTTVPADESSVS